LNASNFASCKQRLLAVIERCRGIGFEITEEEERSHVAELKAEYEKEVRAALEREEQARIKAQIREEQKVEREIQREQERIAREKSIVEAALAKALASAADEHSAEVESLKARLAEAEAKERAISQAQLTKAGFVYVISNIGSFGEGVFKVGMTRRLEPSDRIRELGDASVPFPFDVHMMISCANAPTLENALHKALVKHQLNKTNPRKEFFRTDIDTLVRLVKENHGEVEYIADAEALQYKQSLSMSDEDLEFIEEVYDEIGDVDEALEDTTEPVSLPPQIAG
jgi:DNA repair exonuclease SbcCD ATPase subunit